jgi:hypothetical protein
MTETRLEQIRARERIASPGPWRVVRMPNVYPSPAGDGHTHPALRGLRAAKRLYDRAWEQVEQDMAFMAGARQDVPELLTEVAHLRQQLLQLKRQLKAAAVAAPAGIAEDLDDLCRAIDAEEHRWK